MHRQVLRLGRRIAIALVGGAVIVAGVVLSVPLVPGPGIPLLLLGLGILSLEFQWARVWLARIKAKGMQFKQWFTRELAPIKAKCTQLKQWFTRKRPGPGDSQ